MISHTAKQVVLEEKLRDRIARAVGAQQGEMAKALSFSVMVSGVTTFEVRKSRMLGVIEQFRLRDEIANPGDPARKQFTFNRNWEHLYGEQIEGQVS